MEQDQGAGSLRTAMGRWRAWQGQGRWTLGPEKCHGNLWFKLGNGKTTKATSTCETILNEKSTIHCTRMLPNLYIHLRYILTIHDCLVKSILPAMQKPLCRFLVEKDTGGQGPSGDGERKPIAWKSRHFIWKKNYSTVFSEKSTCNLYRQRTFYLKWPGSEVIVENKRVRISEPEDQDLVHKTSWPQSSNL